MSSYPPPGPYGNDPYNQPGQSGFPGSDPYAAQPGSPAEGQSNPYPNYGSTDPYNPPNNPYGADPASAPPNYNAPTSGQPPYYGAPQQPGNAPNSFGGYGTEQFPPSFGGDGQFGPPPNKSNTGLILGVIAAVLLLAVLGVGGFFLLKDDDKDSKKSDKADSANQNGKDKNGPTEPNPSAPADEGEESGELASSGDTISPRGALYSYEVPRGFDEAQVPKRQVETLGLEHATIITSNKNGDIGVGPSIMVAELAPAMSLEDRRNMVQQRLPNTTIDTVTVDGEQSLRVAGTSPDGQNFFYVYRNVEQTSLYIACIGPQAEASAVRVGCGDVVVSIKTK